MNRINLGDKVKDQVTGFHGVAVSRHTYLQGCDRITVQPPIDKDSKHPDAVSFDEPQLDVLESSVVKPDPTPQQYRTGGPEKYADAGR